MAGVGPEAGSTSMDFTDRQWSPLKPLVPEPLQWLIPMARSHTTQTERRGGSVVRRCFFYGHADRVQPLTPEQNVHRPQIGPDEIVQLRGRVVHSRMK